MKLQNSSGLKKSLLFWVGVLEKRGGDVGGQGGTWMSSCNIVSQKKVHNHVFVGNLGGFDSVRW